MTIDISRLATVIPITGDHRRSLRAGVVTDHTQAKHSGPHHMGWAEGDNCPRCYPAAYAIDHAKHRAPGVAS